MLVYCRRKKQDQQPDRIAVTLLGIPGEIFFAGKILQQKTLYPKPQNAFIAHDTLQLMHIAQIACLLPEVARESP